PAEARSPRQAPAGVPKRPMNLRLRHYADTGMPDSEPPGGVDGFLSSLFETQIRALDCSALGSCSDAGDQGRTQELVDGLASAGIPPLHRAPAVEGRADRNACPDLEQEVGTLRRPAHLLLF